MISKIKSKFQSEDNKRLLSNFFSLSVLQGVNYILPLITIPYLVRVLGIELYGLLAFASVTIAYFVMLTDYGFNLTATREISIHRNNKEKVIEIFSSVMTIRFILMILSFILLSILVFSFEKFSKDWLVYFLTFGAVIGQFLFPIWFFQGMEKMKYIAYLNISVKVFFTLLIFVFIHEKSDYYIVPILTSIGSIISGVLALVIIRKEFEIKFLFQPFYKIKDYFIKSWNVFLITVSNNLYESTSIFLVGIFFNNEAVGYFAIIDKIKNIIRSFFYPVTQTLFPHMTDVYKNKNKYFYSKLNKVIFILLSLSLIIFISIYSLSSIVSLILMGNKDALFIELLIIMIFILPTLPLTSVLGPVAIIIGKEKALLMIMFISGVISIFTISLFASKIGLQGVVYITVLIQYIISIGVITIVYLNKKRMING